MSAVTLLIVILLVLLIFSLPTWPHTRNAGIGWGPSGIVGILLVVLVVLLLLRVI